MVLQNFPELLKVKCFPHTQVSEENGSIDTCCPRSLLLIPISPLYNDGSFQWDPCVRGNLLYKIREFVQNNCPGISKVQVRNPFFDKLQVRCNIVLRSLENEGEAILDLNEKISRFLSPWYLYVNEVDKSKVGGIVKHFGWSIQKEKLIAFIFDHKRLCDGPDLRKACGKNGRQYSAWRRYCNGLPHGDDWGMICVIYLF